MVRDSGASKSSAVKVSQQTIGKATREGGSSSGPRDPWQFSERKDSDFKSLPPLPPISARTNGSMYQYNTTSQAKASYMLATWHFLQWMKCYPDLVFLHYLH